MPAMGERLRGRVALITGAASGIGREIARTFAGEGAVLVLGDINAALLGEASAELGSVEVLAGDVRDEAYLERLVDVAIARHGRLDVAVNSAGVGTFAPITELTEEQWDFVVDVNLKGLAFSIKHEARSMEKQGSGVIINLASINSRQPGQGMSAYCAAKAGVEMLTKVGALELGTKGIRVVAIGPGLVETPLTEFSRAIPAIADDYLANVPMGRLGRTTDIASAALFLASDDASWVSGVTLFVDGGALTKRYPELFRILGREG